jgi:hypothetical protein
MIDPKTVVNPETGMLFTKDEVAFLDYEYFQSSFGPSPRFRDNPSFTRQAYVDTDQRIDFMNTLWSNSDYSLEGTQEGIVLKDSSGKSLGRLSLFDEPPPSFDKGLIRTSGRYIFLPLYGALIAFDKTKADLWVERFFYFVQPEEISGMVVSDDKLLVATSSFVRQEYTNDAYGGQLVTRAFDIYCLQLSQ